MHWRSLGLLGYEKRLYIDGKLAYSDSTSKRHARIGPLSSQDKAKLHRSRMLVKPPERNVA